MSLQEASTALLQAFEIIGSMAGSCILISFLAQAVIDLYRKIKQKLYRPIR